MRMPAKGASRMVCRIAQANTNPPKTGDGGHIGPHDLRSHDAHTISEHCHAASRTFVAEMDNLRPNIRVKTQALQAVVTQQEAAAEIQSVGVKFTKGNAMQMVLM